MPLEAAYADPEQGGRLLLRLHTGDGLPRFGPVPARFRLVSTRSLGRLDALRMAPVLQHTGLDEVFPLEAGVSDDVPATVYDRRAMYPEIRR
jgi:hypothetical protein